MYWWRTRKDPLIGLLNITTVTLYTYDILETKEGLTKLVNWAK